MFRRSKPLPAPPSRSEDAGEQTGTVKRRKWVRWVVILSVVTAAGLARNQYPRLVETITDIPFVQDAFQGLTGLPLADLFNLGPEPAVLQSEPDTAADASKAADQPATLDQANTLHAQATPSGATDEQPSGETGDTELAAQVQPAQAIASPVWAVGTVVQGTAGLSQIPLRMDPDADNAAMIAAMYAPGTNFSIVEAPLEVQYPVVVDGEGWWRVQTEDGLVGWVQEAHLE